MQTQTNQTQVPVRQAMILAAGKGERMLPLSRNLPKPLFEINGTTLIERHLKNLAKAGIEQVVINTHYLGEMIIERLGNTRFGMSLEYSQEETLLETAGGIRAALPLLGDDPFLIVNGDIYTDFSFAELTEVDPERLPHLVMVPNPPHHPEGDYSVDGDGLLHSGGSAPLTYSGIGVYSAAFFAHVAPGNRKLRPLFDAAARRGALFGEVYRGVWSDVGTPERYAALSSRAR
jgi:MurNAc alpha-1-phosphate uridylyltransferase